MNKVKLSIIIPYYKTYVLTIKLLDCLLSQMSAREDVEIILINDGCLEDDFSMYASDNVRIYTQENQGVAKTRNFGIEAAQGEFVAFIDCDDQVTYDYVNILLNAIDRHTTDIINFNWVDLTTNIVYRNPSNYAPWKAIYKRNKIPRFREDREYGEEDIDFQKEIEEGIRNKTYTIAYLDRILYLYLSQRPGSLTWRKEWDKVE